MLSEKIMEGLDHYARMFRVEADTLSELCSTERYDINIGYVLGQSQSHMMDCSIKMHELINEIKNSMEKEDGVS